MTTDNVKVEKLVQEFLSAQTLKILPQTSFGDAVGQFVEKADRYAMQNFVTDSLNGQVKGILAQQQGSDDEDLNPIMERLRLEQEAAFASGVRKRPKKKGKLRPRPLDFDSDENGEWEDQPDAYEDGDDDDLAASDENASMIAAAPGGKQAPAKKVPAKRAPAKPKAPAKAKAPAKPKAPAKTPARGRKKVVDPEPSDDEDVDDDVVMFDTPPPAKSQPKRVVATKPRQTQLSFSQAPKSQASMERSDDEISDDAFEPIQSSRRR
jgi:double-strand break repair protein MRE11